MNVAKYSANGNDFVLFHSFIKKDRSTLAKEICDDYEIIVVDDGSTDGCGDIVDGLASVHFISIRILKRSAISCQALRSK